MRPVNWLAILMGVLGGVGVLGYVHASTRGRWLAEMHKRAES